jgi:hypothetical protein
VATVLIVGSFGLYFTITRGLCSVEWKDIINIIVGALVANLTAIVQYYFGSSDGSARKNEVIAELAAKK